MTRPRRYWLSSIQRSTCCRVPIVPVPVMFILRLPPRVSGARAAGLGDSVCTADDHPVAAVSYRGVGRTAFGDSDGRRNADGLTWDTTVERRRRRASERPARQEIHPSAI